MDIHRCRFVPYHPSGINALAFSHAPPTEPNKKPPDSLRLAIGRANGDIEIWNPSCGSWFQETTLRGGKDRSIEGLAWTQDPDEEDEQGQTRPGKLRLFSIGYSTYVTEWDLAAGKPSRHSDGNYGEVWCLAAQPRLFSTKDGIKGGNKADDGSQVLATQDLGIGCADGAVVLLSTDDGDLRFKRLLSSRSVKKARVLSIVFRNRSIVVTGCADSTIRILDARNGQVIRNLSLGAGPLAGPRETLVWSVKCLSNGDIVSGDSTGEIRFWDGKTWSLLQRLKSHRADILSLEASADGQTLISGGMDRRTTLYKRTGGEKGNKRTRWATVAHSRLHSHDVKAMAVFDSKTLSVVASGGLDTTPIMIPLREYGRENHRTISSLPQYPPVQSAPDKRYLMSWWDREIWIWHVYNPARGMDSGIEEASPEGAQSPKLLARIYIKGIENISSASLSACGTLLAVSTISEVKLFHLGPRKSEAESALRVRRVKLPSSVSQCGGRLLHLSPDTRWLCIITADSTVYMARIIKGQEASGRVEVLSTLVQLRRTNPKIRVQPASDLPEDLGSYVRTINRATFSADSRILVAGDISGHIYSWVLTGYEDLNRMDIDPETHEDSASSSSSDTEANESRLRNETRVIFGQSWSQNPSALLIPTLPSAALILSFRPSSSSQTSQLTNGTSHVHPTRHNPHPLSKVPIVSEDRLLIITVEHQVYEFEVLKGRLTAWSRRNPTPSFPKEFRSWKDRAMGCVWDIGENKERAWIFGSAWLCMFDLSQDFPAQMPGARATEDDKLHRRKRKRTEDDQEGRRPTTSGAGSKILEAQLSVTLGRKMRKFNGPNDSKPTVISLDSAEGDDSSIEEDTAGELELARSRRDLVSHTDPHGADDGSHNKKQTVLTNGSEVAKSTLKDRRPSFWSTYRYRPILGLVSMVRVSTHGGDTIMKDSHQADTGQTEVVLVERPMWDVDLPPRFYGDQEWDKAIERLR